MNYQSLHELREENLELTRMLKIETYQRSKDKNTIDAYKFGSKFFLVLFILAMSYIALS